MDIIKPADFQFGLRDFLTILVPGAVLAFAASPWHPYLFGPDRLFPVPTGEAGSAAAFLITAYISGHLVEAVASALLDPVYDRTYRTIRRLAPAKGITRPFGERVRRAWRLRDAEVYDPLLDAASAIHEARLAERSIHTPLTGSPLPSVLDWAQSAVVLRASAGATEIESLQAASKFFRSMAVVAPLVPVLSLLRLGSLRSLSAPSTATMSFTALFVGAGLAVVLAHRFMKLRWAATQRTYEYYIESHVVRKEATCVLE
jgi:hypothetical protein